MQSCLSFVISDNGNVESMTHGLIFSYLFVLPA